MSRPIPLGSGASVPASCTGRWGLASEGSLASLAITPSDVPLLTFRQPDETVTCARRVSKGGVAVAIPPVRRRVRYMVLGTWSVVVCACAVSQTDVSEAARKLQRGPAPVLCGLLRLSSASLFL